MADKSTDEIDLAQLLEAAPEEAVAAVEAYEPVEREYLAAMSAMNPANLYVTSANTNYRPE